MVQRRDLNQSPDQYLDEIVQELLNAAKSSKTGAHGTKSLGKTGDTTWVDPATGEEQSVRDLPPLVSEVGQQVEDAKESLADLELSQADLVNVRLPALEEDLDQAGAQALAKYAEYDAKFDEVPSSEELQEVRTELGTVLGAATTAQETADAAAAAAATADANALAAAGIAADKGRVYYQGAAPTSAESKSVHNLWIDSDDGKVYVWNTTTNSWTESESQSLRDAAQSALLAQQTADAAVANAAAAASKAAEALAAAVAAQQTADQSTLDAAAAHNAAVAAQGDATDALDKYGPLDQRTVAAQAAAAAAQAAADAAAGVAGQAKGLAEDAVREVGDTVRGYANQYAVGASETVAPTTGWSANTPTRTPGTFVWVRTVVTYADGDTETTAPVLVTGNAGATGAKGATGATGATGAKGDDGVPGAPGVGLQSTAVTYALSTSGTTAPTTGYTAAVPTLVKGRYLWTRSVWTYTNSTSETGYSVAYVAQDGAKGNDGLPGAPGVGITGTTVTYAASSSGTVAPTTGWASQPPSAAPGQFVWTRTVWAYSNGTSETGYSVGKLGETGAKGDTGSTGATGATGSTGAKGDTGATGTGVSSVVPFFRAVARTAAAPAQPSGTAPSGWSTTEPAWNSANKLYRAERVTYTTGAVSWTAPVLVATYEGIVAVAASANGKNASTFSLDAPTSGTPGVVAGDTWWRVDSGGNIFGQWRWTGSVWSAAAIRSEVIANLDVGKLVVIGGSRFSDAVVENLWVNSLVAKVAVFQELTVATGNLVPNGDFSQGLELWRTDAPWTVEEVTGFGPHTKALTSSGGTVSNGWQGPALPVKGGEKYAFECWIQADKPDSRFFLEMRDQTGALVAVDSVITEGGSGSSGAYMLSSYLVPTVPTKYRVEFTARAGAETARLASFYFNHPNGTERTAKVWITGLAVRPEKGVVHIANGQVGADEVNAESVAAAVGEFVEVKTSNLVADAAAVDTAVILKLASEMVTSGLFRTSDVGARVQIDSTGVVVYSGETDDNGVELESARLGPSGENFLTIGKSTVSQESVRSPSGAFDTLSVGGVDLDALLFSLPQGVVGFAYEDVSSAYDGTGTELVRLQAEVVLQPNRRYSVTVDQHYVQSRTSSASSYVEQIRWSNNGATVTNTHAVVASARHFLAATTTPETVPTLTGWIDTHEDNDGFGTSPRTCKFAVCTRSAGGVDMRVIARGDYALRITVRDEGPTLQATGQSWFHVGTPSGGASEAPAPKPVVTRYKDVVWAHGGYGGDTKDGLVYQGTLSPYGNRWGGWLFPSAMRSALAGSTIEKLEVWLENEHWWYGSGGTGVIYANNGSYKSVLGSGTTSSGWPRDAGRWVPLPSSWYTSVVNGTYKGVSVYTTNTSLLYYGQFRGAPTKFRATYRK